MCSHLYLSWLDNMNFNLKMVFCNFVTFSELNGLDYETDLVLCFCLTFTWPRPASKPLWYTRSAVEVEIWDYNAALLWDIFPSIFVDIMQNNMKNRKKL